jgi:predicted phage tail protein
MGAIWQIRKFRGARWQLQFPHADRTARRSPVGCKAKILLALGEGEFSGGLTGQSIFLDGTPLLNADGSSNFSGVTWEFRAGTQAQPYIQGMPGSENEISAGGITVSSATAWTRTFTNPQLSAVRLRLKWPSIFRQEDDGDLVGYSINYALICRQTAARSRR